MALTLVAIAAGRVLFQARPASLTLDERDYLRAAVHLARDGVLWSGPAVERPDRGDALREPGYPAVLAAAWTLAGVDVGFAEDEFATGARAAPARRVAARLNLALLGVGAAAAAAAVGLLGGGEISAALAAVAVLASPALTRSSPLLASENLAAPLVALCGVALVAASRREATDSLLLPALAGVAAGLLPLVRGAGIVAAPAGIAILLIGPRLLGRGGRVGRTWIARVLVFSLPAVLLPGLWMARNVEQVGHPVIADRGGVVLQIRLELDRQLSEEGLLPALLEWTPLAAAKRLRERVAPGSRLTTFRWRGDQGNYFTRAIQRWQDLRASSGDSLEVDRHLRREALAGFLERPRAHLSASLAVAWRGLFAERSPSALVDLRLPIGLALLAGSLVLLGRGVRDRDPRPLALLVLPALLFAFHAGVTEFLPRFGVPALPLLWAATVAAVAGLPASREGGELAGAEAAVDVDCPPGDASPSRSSPPAVPRSPPPS